MLKAVTEPVDSSLAAVGRRSEAMQNGLVMVREEGMPSFIEKSTHMDDFSRQCQVDDTMEVQSDFTEEKGVFPNFAETPHVPEKDENVSLLDSEDENISKESFF